MTTKKRDTEHHDSESIDEILSSGSDSDANNGREKTDGITNLGLMHVHMGGLGLMSAFTRLHEFTAPTVHLANMTGMVASAVPEKQNFGRRVDLIAVNLTCVSEGSFLRHNTHNLRQRLLKIRQTN